MRAMAGSAWTANEAEGLQFSVSTWNKESRSVWVANFTTTGQPVGDRDWAKVTVPFSALLADGVDWDLSNVELLRW